MAAGSQEIRANGARSGDNNFMLNGVDANSYGGNMAEATRQYWWRAGDNGTGRDPGVQGPEFALRCSVWAAEVPRNVLSSESKSGMAAVHGNVYYFGRDDALNATILCKCGRACKVDFRRHQPGATLGAGGHYLVLGLFLRFLRSHPNPRRRSPAACRYFNSACRQYLRCAAPPLLERSSVVKRGSLFPWRSFFCSPTSIELLSTC